ncbi:hypothetical protein HDV63DRAFT_409316 [Trichoderma sp. SZMC 28014]
MQKPKLSLLSATPPISLHSHNKPPPQKQIIFNPKIKSKLLTMSQSIPSDSALTASYSSPASAPFSISKSIPAPPTPLDPAGKSTYLESLRASVAAAQDQINKELTTRMEEDKAREGGAAAVDEEKEEENYGEEVQEEED